MIEFFRKRLPVLAAVAAVAGIVVSVAGAEDWPTYLHDSARSGTSGETNLSAQNAGQLQKVWSFTTGGGVAASPAVVGGVVYVGSWDGFEYALNASTGVLIWKTFLGITNGGAACNPQQAGVTSAAAVVNGVVYVGGGDNFWYALDATTGAILWKIDVGNPNGNTYDGHYNWASPLIHNGFAYIGIASFGDCPLVQGGLRKVDLSTHQVVASWNAVPNGQVGGGVWTSPTLDTATNTIYVTTGTKTSASQLNAEAFVALDAATLAPEGSWQVPAAQQVSDGDWGNTPTLLSGGLVTATNKNGVAYAFQGSNVSAGPVWQQHVAVGGACPLCGDGPVSSDAFDGSRLYAGAGQNTVNGKTVPGSISAFNPSNGQALWTAPLSGIVIPALAAVNGLVIAGVGNNVMVFDAATGATLFSYATSNLIYSPASVSGGMIYIGSQDGRIYAFGLGQSHPPPPNTVRVNAGGAAYTDSSGNSWSADTGFSGGLTYSNNVSIAGTSDPALYQSQRWNRGPFSYTFTGLAAGSYQVTLKFAEIAYLGPGKRQFNVAIQGTRVLTNFDVAAQVGLNTALDKTLTASVDSSGQLTIAFTQGAANNPIVNAIQVVPVSSSGSLSFATGPQTLTAGQPSAAMQVAVSSAQQSPLSVGLSSSSSAGQFSTSPSGPWSSTLAVSIPAGQTTSGSFYYEDSLAGNPVLTASTSGFTSAVQTETVTGTAAVRVNAGGAAYTDSSGNSWSADTGFSGGLTYSNNVSIAGTSDPALYQSQRWNRGPFSYTFTGLAAGSYQVTLKFAEIAYLGPGKRQFNVAIQGTRVLTNFDVAAQVGLNTALDKTLTASVDSSGQLTIAFTQGAANNPIVNAIQVVPAG